MQKEDAKKRVNGYVDEWLVSGKEVSVDDWVDGPAGYRIQDDQEDDGKEERGTPRAQTIKEFRRYDVIR